MTAATHVTVSAADTIVVLHDGRVRITDGTWSCTIEVRDPGTAHRLAQALEDVRDTLTEAKTHRLATLERVTA